MNSDHPRPRARGRIVALAVWICALAFVVLASRARAQSESDGQSAEYRDLIEQALSEFKHKNWPEARVLFRRAHELSPNARTLRGMGVVSYEMRDYVNAVLALSAALADQRQPLTDAQRKECEGLLSRSRTFVATYALTLDPASAEVTLDSAPLSRDAEGRVLVPFGEHTLHAFAPGYEESTSKLAVQGGEQGELRVVLYHRSQASAAPANGEKSVAVIVPSPPSGRAATPTSPPPPSGMVGGGLRYSWVALGASAVFGAAWAGSWFVGQSKLDELDANCKSAAATGSPCQRGQVDTSNVERFEKISNVMMGLTAGAVVATAVLMAIEWPRERQVGQARNRNRAPSRSERAAAQSWKLGLGAGRVALQGSF